MFSFYVEPVYTYEELVSRPPSTLRCPNTLCRGDFAHFPVKTPSSACVPVVSRNLGCGNNTVHNLSFPWNIRFLGVRIVAALPHSLYLCSFPFSFSLPRVHFHQPLSPRLDSPHRTRINDDAAAVHRVPRTEKDATARNRRLDARPQQREKSYDIEITVALLR